MWQVIFNYQNNLFRRYFRTERLARSITAVIFLAVLLAVALGIYSFSYQGFKFILQDVYFAQAMQLYAYEIFFALISFLVLGSAVVSGLRFLFRPEGDTWILASPRFSILPPYALYQVSSASLWPIIIMAVPMLLGRLAAGGGTFIAVGISLVALIALTAGAVLAGLVTILVWAQVLALIGGWFKRRVLTRGFLALVVSLTIIMLGVWGGRQIFNMDIVQLFAIYPVREYPADCVGKNSIANVACREGSMGISGNFSNGVNQTPLTVKLNAIGDVAARARLTEQVESATQATTGAITESFRGFPSHPVAEVLYRSFNDGWSGNLAGDLIVIVLAILLLGIIFWLLTKRYLLLWQVLQEGSHRLRSGSFNSLRSVRSQLGTIFRVEILRTLRGTQNILWLGFLMLLWLAQTGLNVLLRRNLARYHVAASDVPNIIQSLQILTAVFFVSAFVLRFVLPAFSAERKTAWLIGSAPLATRKLYWGKLSVYACLFGGLSLAVAFWNAAVLGVAPSAWLPFLGFTLGAALTVTGVGLALGGIFPNFETDDPETVATSLPGLTFTLSALAYGGWAAQAYYQLTIVGQPISAIAVLLVSIGAVIGFSRLAIQRLRRMEFVPT